jgi:hypothetical protein
MSRNIDDLSEPMERIARAFLLECRKEGLSVAVTSTLRTEDEQVALFSQGRGWLELVNLLRRRAGLKPIDDSANKKTVTLCDGVNAKSRHQGGNAMDVVLLDKFGKPIWNVALAVADYKKLGKIAKKLGLTYGGDFTPIDPVTGLGWDPFHVEL